MKNFLIAAAIILLTVGIAIAVDANISYKIPTQNTDGSVLLEQDLDFYTMYCDGVPLTTFDSIMGNRTALVSLDGLTEGDHACDLRVTALNGQESGASNVVNFTIGPRVPMAPTGLTLILQ